jgi:16S rRNA (adenine1518-N6/adenine1519-N6)-dimethyltransferase
MIDQNLVRLIAAAGSCVPGDLVIEVGPGTGTLTEELLATGARVLAVEIDRDLAAELRRRFNAQLESGGFQLLEGDALDGKHDLNPTLLDEIRQALARNMTVKLVANLPYNVASPLVIDLMLQGVQRLAFTVQKEVGQRMKAAAGSELYGPLSVICQYLADVSIERTLPPGAFWPPPKIDSALILLTVNGPIPADAADFSKFVGSVFAYRRKTLKRALVESGFEIIQPESGDAALGLLRVETLSPGELHSLFLRCRRAL